MADLELDVSEVLKLAKDLGSEGRKQQIRNQAALDEGIDYVFDTAIATATPWRDTGDMIAATKKVGRGYTRAVRCTDPAGLMNDRGTVNMAPRPWLGHLAEPGGKVVEASLARSIDEFLR